MIKEIEVGGVKHSITLADDMVGDGLKKTLSGRIYVDIATNVLSGGQFMTGLSFSGGKLILEKRPIAQALAGGSANASLLHQNGILIVNTTGLAQDYIFRSGLASGLAGSGLEDKNGQLSLSTGIVGSGLVRNGFSNAIEVLIDYSPGSGGLKLSSSGLSVQAGSGLMLEDGNVNIDYSNLFDSNSFKLIYGPITSVGVKVTSGLEIYPGNGLKVKIAKRSSGLRLILNDNGELDVTQD